MDKTAEQLLVVMTTYGVRVLGVVVVLAVAWGIGGLARRAINRSLGRANFDATLTRFFATTARYVILTLAVIGCLGLFGIETTSFAAILGAAGLAIGLALQGTLGNLASGIMLLIFRPFKVGDVVSVAGQVGSVEELGLFTTQLKTPDNRKIILPNGTVFGGTIENITHHPTRRVEVAVGVDYAADIDATRKVLEEATSRVSGVIDEPPAQVFLAELGASSVDWKVRVWCKTEDFWDVHQRAVRAVKQALDAAGIGIPFPQLDVHVDRTIYDGDTAARQPEATA